MRFNTLNESIPWTTGGKKHFFTAQIYPGVEISAPGRHQFDTDPVGGDAVVLISDEYMDWNRHQFTHVDIFKDAETKKNVPSAFWDAYYDVICLGKDPAKYDFDRDYCDGIHPMTFLYASQVLSVIEHRRYHAFESKFGGRFLPARFLFGIVDGLWGASDAASLQRKGRPGVEILERAHGTPTLTKELTNHDG